MSDIRQFETGATRDTNTNKPDYRGFYSVLVARRFGEYMHKHRLQADGSLRESDNWKKGIPEIEYVSSGDRHWMDIKECYEALQFGYFSNVNLEDALCAMLFNVQGLLHEVVKARLEGEYNAKSLQ